MVEGVVRLAVCTRVLGLEYPRDTAFGSPKSGA